MMTKSKNYKKRIAILSILCMVISLMPASSFGLEPSDISGHWAKDNIQTWIGGGLINGYEDGTFRPDSNISRAEFMTLVNKAYNYSTEAEIGFSDVKASDWYFSAVAKAKAAGYISGYPDNTIRPEGSITRSEAAAIIMRINKLEGNLAAASKFTDALKLDWGAEAIGAVYKHAIMNGYPDGSFMAQSFIKRGESLVALDKAKAYAKGNTTYDVAGTYGPASGTLAVEGNVIITKQDTTLQNMVINGDLTIRKSVGEGDVALNNVTVKGETLVCGGGPNSVWAYNSRFGTVTIIKEVGDIRFLISGTTTVEMVIADSSVKLEEQDMVGANVGFVEVHFEGQPQETLILIGCFGDVDVNTPNTYVEMPSGTTVDSMCLNQRTDVTGEGLVALANIFVDGSTFEFSPETFDIIEGVLPPATENPPAEVVVTPPSGGGHVDSTVVVNGITISANGNATAVVSGGALTMSAIITPSNATNKDVVWTVGSGSGSATIDSSRGLLTATSVGTVAAIATAQDGSGKTATYELTIATSMVTSGSYIQAAIDAATAGGVLMIQNGTYIASNTTINKSLTLIGESKAGVIIAPAAEDSQASLDYGGTAQQGIIVVADNVTIKDLTIDGDANNIANGGALTNQHNFRTGIITISSTLAGPYNNLTVDNVVVRNCVLKGISLSKTSSGGHIIKDSLIENIAIKHGIYSQAADVIITGNTIRGTGMGILFSTGVVTPSSKTTTITNNTLYDIAGKYSTYYNGTGWVSGAIYYRNPDIDETVIITGNKLTIGDGAEVNSPGVCGMYIYNTDSSSKISNNTIDSTSGTNNWGIYLGGSAGTTVDGNTFTMNESDSGIYLGRGVAGTPTPNIVSNNTFTSTGSTSSGSAIEEGVAILQSNDGGVFWMAEIPYYTNTTITGNAISGFVRGIVLYEKASGTYVQTGTTVKATISNNRIYDCTLYGVDASTLTTTGAIDAELNYWGAASGPYNLTTNAIGTGNAVSDKVDYDPWYTTSGMTTTATAVITDADVSITQGSIEFQYSFDAGSSTLTYGNAQASPYYLSTTGSTVTLTDGTSSSAIVSLSALGISNSGVVSYENIEEIQSKFADLNFVPTRIILHLAGGVGSTVWTKEVTIVLESEEIALLGSS